MQLSEEKIKGVEKILKEPVAAQFSEQTWRIRTNLILASSIALVMGLAKLHIAPDSTFLGLRFNGLDDGVVRMTLAGVVLYLLFHFVWSGWDSFLEWRLRITGTRSAFQTGSFWAPDHVDYPVEPHQSTLYNWWAAQQNEIGKIGQLATKLQETMRGWETDIQNIREGKTDPYSHNLNNVIRGLADVRERTAKLIGCVEANTKVITDERIPVSLKRFDEWFRLFLKSQNLRWLVIEFAAPAAFSVTALYHLLK